MICVSYSLQVQAAFKSYGEDERHYTDSTNSDVRPLIAAPFLTEDDIKDIKDGRVAAVTLCTQPQGSVDHVSVVFEYAANFCKEEERKDKGSDCAGASIYGTGDPLPPRSEECVLVQQEEASPACTHLVLYNIHFGGDGYTKMDRGRNFPLIDKYKPTLSKIYRSRQVDIDKQEHSLPPLYTRRLVFLVLRDNAEQVIQSVLEEANGPEKRQYAMLPRWRSTQDNCCTYARHWLQCLGVHISTYPPSFFAHGLINNCLKCPVVEGVKRRSMPEFLQPYVTYEKRQKYAEKKQGMMAVCSQDNGELALVFMHVLDHIQNFKVLMFVEKRAERENTPYKVVRREPLGTQNVRPLKEWEFGDTQVKLCIEQVEAETVRSEFPTTAEDYFLHFLQRQKDIDHELSKLRPKNKPSYITPAKFLEDFFKGDGGVYCQGSKNPSPGGDEVPLGADFFSPRFPS